MSLSILQKRPCVSSKLNPPSYSLLSQFPADAGPGPGPPPATVLQRQSSGSSYGAGSSISASSDYPFHLQAPASAAGVAPPGSDAAAPGGSSPCKSWAQQAEETYQLQLALALRLCADAACAADPGFLDPGDAGSGRGSRNGRAFPLAQPAPSAESLSHRFWVNGSLSYNSPIPDGFYMIHGMDPFVWSLCTDNEENRITQICLSRRFFNSNHSHRSGN